MKYCAIEGSSFAGKTTICDMLAKLGIATIGEYDTYMKLNVDPINLDDHKAFIDTFIQAERQRSMDVAKQSSEIVVSDRSIISLLTFDDMATKYNIGNPAVRPAAREYLNERLEREVYLGNIITNNCVVVVRLDDESVFNQRVQSRGVTPVTQLADFPTSQYIADRSAHYAGYLLGKSSVTQVDVSPYDRISAALAILDAVTITETGIFMSARLGDVI